MAATLLVREPSATIATVFRRTALADLDRVEFFFLGDLLEQVEQSFHSSLLVETSMCSKDGIRQAGDPAALQ